ncbi:MAG: hypothetical protein QF443_04300, partial [Dehalococcoidia bacterium]|nr:hypothetical protein [Dehalococcoidia bacterium]
IKSIEDLKKQAIKNNINYVGFGEIIVQHAPHNHSKLKYEVGLFFDYLNSKTAGDIFERHGFMTFTLATSK